MNTEKFRGRRIISDQVGPSELRVVWRELEKVLESNIPGDIAEFGCYIGTTSLFIRRLLDEHHESSKRKFHAYDSFEGLPAKSQADESPAGMEFKQGELNVSKKAFLHEFRAANLQPPIIHTGWFSEFTSADVPTQIAFAFLDGDFYESILTSLQLVWPHMSGGGIIIVDDYKREATPGVERAIRHFLQGKKVRQPGIEAQMAMIRL